MKIYCPDCGTPVNYTNKKPNFCSNCGLSYTKGESQALGHIDEDDTQQEQVTERGRSFAGNLNSLNIEIDANAYKGIEIQNVVQPIEKGSGPTIKQRRQPPPQGIQETNIQDQFQKEAGSLKKKNS